MADPIRTVYLIFEECFGRRPREGWAPEVEAYKTAMSQHVSNVARSIRTEVRAGQQTNLEAINKLAEHMRDELARLRDDS